MFSVSLYVLTLLTLPLFVQELEPLPTLVMLPSLSEQQLEECHKVIVDLQAREAANDPLAVPSSGGRNKGVKR